MSVASWLVRLPLKLERATRTLSDISVVPNSLYRAAGHGLVTLVLLLLVLGLFLHAVVVPGRGFRESIGGGAGEDAGGGGELASLQQGVRKYG